MNDPRTGKSCRNVIMQGSHEKALRLRHFGTREGGEESTCQRRGNKKPEGKRRVEGLHQLRPSPRSKLCSKTALSLSRAVTTSFPLPWAGTLKVIAGSAASEISLSRCNKFSPFRLISTLFRKRAGVKPWVCGSLCMPLKF